MVPFHALLKHHNKSYHASKIFVDEDLNIAPPREEQKLMLKKIPKISSRAFFFFLQLNEIIRPNSPVVALFNLILSEIIMFFFFLAVCVCVPACVCYL